MKERCDTPRPQEAILEFPAEHRVVQSTEKLFRTAAGNSARAGMVSTAGDSRSTSILPNPASSI